MRASSLKSTPAVRSHTRFPLLGVAFSAAAILCVRFADFQVNFRRPGRRREGVEKASVKQKAAIIPGIFGLEMSKYLYDEAHLKVSGLRGVHRQHHYRVLGAPSVRQRWFKSAKHLIGGLHLAPTDPTRQRWRAKLHRAVSDPGSPKLKTQPYPSGSQRAWPRSSARLFCGGSNMYNVDPVWRV